MLNHLFLDQSMEFLPGETFTKSGKTLKVSKAGLLPRIPDHPLRLWYRNLTALAADTLPKRAIVDMGTSVPFTTQALMVFHVTLRFSIRLDGALCDLVTIDFPVDP